MIKLKPGELSFSKGKHKRDVDKENWEIIKYIDEKPRKLHKT